MTKSELVNRLKEVALEYHSTQQLRQRILRVLTEYWDSVEDKDDN